MRFVVALLAVCALGCVSATLMEENYQFLFTSWASQHHKSYHTPDEFQYRYQVFKHNLDYISSHTTRKPNATYTLKMNKFGDLTNDEFVAKYTGYVPTPRSNALVSSQLSTSDLPASVDWNAKGMVTPVKNQGSCGSCWAFSTTGSTESAHAIKTGNLISLSEQELVDCSKNGNEGCNGGDMVLAFQWIMQAGGLCSESDYPYEGVDGTCPSPLNCTAQFNISGYKTVTVNSESQLQAAVAMQPVSVAVDAAGLDWQFYFGGVVSDACGYQLDHGVLAAGYGTDAISGQQFWLVKNSWGADWGESGYIRLLRNAPNTSGQGECGIAMDPSYPIA